MIPFFSRMLSFVQENNKTPILWCELDNIYPPANDYLFPYPKNVTLVSWRGGLTPTCLELTRKHGNPLIMAPGEYAYLDYPQLKGDFPEFNNWGMPVTTSTRDMACLPKIRLISPELWELYGEKRYETLTGQLIWHIPALSHWQKPDGHK
mgnify:CR=1 FL=1